MASVYRAHQNSIHRDIALKVITLNPHDSRQAEFTQRFAREAEYIASLEHIHILPVYAYGIEGDTAYLAMRLLRGGSIKELLKDGQPLEVQHALRLFQQVADGLAYAHSKGIIHRDLKPGNVLLDDEGNAYLTDFGLAKLMSGDMDLTTDGMVVGTLLYIAPEQLRGERLDQRADIYSMGIMLYEMLTGRPPFEGGDGNDVVSVVYQHLEKAPQALSDSNPAITPALNIAVQRALSKFADQRYLTMEAFVQAINEATGSMTTVAFPKVSPLPSETISTDHSPTPAPTNLTMRLGGTIAFIIALALLGAFAVILVRTPPTIPPYAITPGEQILWDALTPTDDQITTAQRALGDAFVAIIACNTTSEYHSTLTRETGVLLRRYGLTFRVYDSENDPYSQRVQLEKALTEGARAFILCPLTYEVIDQTMTAINEQRLPLAAYTQPDNGKAYDIMYTAAENANYAMGEIVGKAAGAWIRDQLNGEAQVILLDFPDMDAIVERANGLEDGILSVAPQATIVDRVTGGTRENGASSLQTLLDAAIPFDVIASINDAGSIGAIGVLEKASVPFDAVAIFSMDAEELAVDYLKRGEYMQGTLEVGRTQTAESTVNAITRLLAGDTLPQVISIPLLNVLTRADVTP